MPVKLQLLIEGSHSDFQVCIAEKRVFSFLFLSFEFSLKEHVIESMAIPRIVVTSTHMYMRTEVVTMVMA